ncbi:hypothetical protein BJ508DRAFT_162829 [Ascobolus immersus RN42]|uniref:Uncharacterized protein n=1 Tax=Ascobolus immersus RN42 TaxID=1160509 RepID=A0A3N4HW43_ASCIM|nr:hypothetical protein BJ508DRAFT_162829 [Ascobolus immersus RN42]
MNRGPGRTQLSRDKTQIRDRRHSSPLSSCDTSTTPVHHLQPFQLPPVLRGSSQPHRHWTSLAGPQKRRETRNKRCDPTNTTLPAKLLAALSN